MLHSAQLLLVLSSSITGLLRKVHWLMLGQVLICFFILSFTNADSRDNPWEAQVLSPVEMPLAPPAMPVLPLPENRPLFHRSRWKNISPFGAPVLGLAPSPPPPHYGPFVTSHHHPPSSSRLSKSSMKNGGLNPPSGLSPPRFAQIAPVQSGALPAGLAQPPLSPHTSDCCGPDMVLKRGTQDCQCVYPLKLDLLLLNVSLNPNWNPFLEEFASQLGLQVSQIELINFYVLGLSRLNISMDITPMKGISFSATEAAQINSSLSSHKVRLDPALVGDYHLLNLTWFMPSAPSQAPLSHVPPAEAPQQLDSRPVASNSSNKGNHSSLVLVIAIGSGILIIAIISIFVICLCATHKEKRRTSVKEPAKMRTADAAPLAGSLPHPPHPTSTRFLAYEELKEATNNFERASILGEGGFGRVFKGVLSDGTAVAIKRLSSGGQQGDKEFLVEVEMLSRLHHRNLVKLVGYYSSRASSQNLLCYELVPNGSLESWLHGPLGVNCPLDWETRMKIALDAARGLAYLHEDSQPCVIHRDFKASNILLENNFHAKVADFGLAKQAPEGRANYLSTRVMGTFGYVAPEYAMTGHLLVKSDVYSYGVVLLELLTGRKPVDMAQPSGQENLVTWARPILRDKDRLEELADPRLEGKYPTEDFVRVCTIAAACVAPEASQRPTMGEVVQSLKMVQRVAEYQDSALSSNSRPNLRQSSTTFESDGTSSIFSSGPYSGLSAFDNDHHSRTAVFSEDLHEGR
ncbi:proline-rich receptor-like protein kinase PERK15 isoform X1 [Coffea eugenioides]|uniref:proline-rich receptor-like protein kinase PERK15 isoform X1 n=1 Tax=Coffea eugenioides TaxID=49369 RepID=UPI000F60A2FF|nr:proline-rich receptor-like protein kinase PERK15 isoform X1 [Coffea eugenioides]